MSHERTALIDGVRLTRAQLEAGLKQLEESKWCRVMHNGGNPMFAHEGGDRIPVIPRTRGDFAWRALALPTYDHYEYQIIPDPHTPSYMLLVCRPKQEAK